jgi:hypothetical protein
MHANTTWRYTIFPAIPVAEEARDLMIINAVSCKLRGAGTWRTMGAGASRDRLKMSVGKLLEEDVPDPAENPEVRLHKA